MTPLSTAPTPSTTTPGNYVWYFTRDYKVCKSNLDSIEVQVHDLPHVQIIDIPSSVCLGDKLYLEATGGSVYQWHTDGNQLFTDKNTNSIYTILMDTATYTVRGTNGYGCYDSASATVSAIGQCCQIACPNAFSPNGDGRNDKYHVVTYGNMQSFELMIFNRWGQLIYLSDDQHASWDGSYHGVPCEVGTYFYMLKAKCLTGHSEQLKGDITLIR
ncbi:MAG: gliding motility-associated C-terminal domain-containing protein [Bacteroidetes bacterium]|nr:gliding motility-associated C-terminal domain-containing protein [Bacteroidota bacterium]